MPSEKLSPSATYELISSTATPETDLCSVTFHNHAFCTLPYATVGFCPGMPGRSGSAHHAQVSAHRVLDQGDERRLGGLPGAGVAHDDRDLRADGQRLPDLLRGVPELSVEAV